MNPAWCNARRHVARGCCSKAKCYRHGPNMRFQWMGFAKQTETWKPLKTVQNLCRKKSARFQWFPKNPLDFPKSISNDTLDTFFCIKRRSRCRQDPSGGFKIVLLHLLRSKIMIQNNIMKNMKHYFFQSPNRENCKLHFRKVPGTNLVITDYANDIWDSVTMCVD